MTNLSTPAFCLLGLLIVLCGLNQSASALPTIDSVDKSPKETSLTQKEAAREATDGGAQLATGQTQAAVAAVSHTKTSKQQRPVVKLKSGSDEKLKRGLSKFMNNLNPAPFFVPTEATPPVRRSNQQLAAAANGANNAATQAEPATIINHGSTADVLIKGPNRLVQARPLGGPLRWGR